MVTTAGSKAAISRETIVCRPQHGGGGHDDRVDRRLRPRAVPAAAEQPHLDVVLLGLRDPRAVADPPGRGWHDVLSQDHVRLGKAVEQMVVDHGLRSCPQLLGGLEQRDERSVPGIRRTREELGGARQPGDVHIVTARA
jgi:hypothetical protein